MQAKWEKSVAYRKPFCWFRTRKIGASRGRGRPSEIKNGEISIQIRLFKSRANLARRGSARESKLGFPPGGADFAHFRFRRATAGVACGKPRSRSWHGKSVSAFGMTPRPTRRVPAPGGFRGVGRSDDGRAAVRGTFLGNRRRTEPLNRLLPEIHLRGLAQGDLEISLCGPLGERGPLWASAIVRPRKKRQVEYGECQSAGSTNPRSCARGAAGCTGRQARRRTERTCRLQWPGGGGAYGRGRPCRGLSRVGSGLIGDLRGRPQRRLNCSRLRDRRRRPGISSGLHKVYLEAERQGCRSHRGSDLLNRILDQLEGQDTVLLSAIPRGETDAEALRLRSSSPRPPPLPLVPCRSGIRFLWRRPRTPSELQRYYDAGCAETEATYS